jgi:hypothetical protein
MRRMLTAMDGRKTINEKRDSISASSLYGYKIPSMNPVTNEPISVNSIKYQNSDLLARPEKYTYLEIQTFMASQKVRGGARAFISDARLAPPDGASCKKPL